jgi:type IV secretion system protein VirB3
MSGAETEREGWELPLAQGLAEPVMLAGMPREYAILMGTLALILGLGLRLWWLGLAWWAVSHALGLWVAKTDKRFFEVLRRHLSRPGHLDA